ncbi:MAG: tetratricopeptide repeat protein, partial [Lachnospiraceae bacterium]|nr:tetratricopeptide repeat protein [Lachnospiraceae bacterium]
MDKYEFNIKVEQIKKLVNRGDYATAMKICDTIDWRRVRNGSLLSMVSQIYEKNEEYQEAKEVLRIAYERAPVGKRILYKLTDLALREGRVGEAETYYREFCEVAQDDPRQYLLRYLILKEKKAPIEQLIRSLEAYTSSELDEKWMYELAELYHKAGLEDKCVATCDTIMLMFGLGKYVDKAMDLKLEYAPLNKYQMDLVENRDKYEAKLRAVEEEYSTKSYAKVEEDTVLEEETPEPEVSAEEPTEEDVIRIHEDEESEKLAQEMAKIAEEPTAIVEEDEMEATRTLDDLHSLKEIKPTQRVLDAAAEREAE